MRFCRHLLLSLAAIFVLSCSQTPVYAQTTYTTNVTQSNLLAGGTPVASAKVCAYAVDQYGNPISFSAPTWGLVLANTPFCGTVVSGAIAGGINVPDANHTNQPSPLRYNFVIQLLSSGTPVGTPISLLNVPNVSGTTYSLDSYSPTTSGYIPASNTLSTGSGIPGPCTAPSLDINTSTGALYYCNGGSYSLVSPPAFNLRGAWAPSTAYAVNDVFSNAGSSYVVTTAFTSGSTFSTTNTMLLAGVGGAGSVSSFNTRTGSIVLTRTDVSSAQGRVNLGLSTDAVLLAGDSIPCGWNTSASACQTPYMYYKYLQTLNQLGSVPTGNWYDTAVPGQTCEQVLSNYSTQIHPYRPSALSTTNTYLILDVGTNSLQGGLDTAAQLHTCQQSILTSANTDGFKTILVTVRPKAWGGGWDQPQEYQRQLYRDLVFADFYTSSPAYFAVVDADSVYGSPNDLTYYQSDGLHPNPVGQAAFAYYLNSVLANPQGNTGPVAKIWGTPVGTGTGNYGCSLVDYPAPMPALTSGSQNTDCGLQNLLAVTSGQYNTAFGYGNLNAVTTGNANVSMGYQNLQALTTGQQNVAVGAYDGNAMTTASYDVLLGPGVASGQVAPQFDVCIGYGACDQTGTGDMGSGNVAIGGLNAKIAGGVSNAVQLGQGTNSTSSSVQIFGANMGSLQGSGWYSWYVDSLYLEGATPSTKSGCVSSGHQLYFDDTYCTAVPAVNAQSRGAIQTDIQGYTSCSTAGYLLEPNAASSTAGCVPYNGPFTASATLTTATSDTVTVTGATASSKCSLTATNATAAGSGLAVYISAKTTNSITISHVATTASGATFDVLCSVN